MAAVVSMVLAGSAQAQGTANPGPSAPGVADAPVPGANSFTEAQARARMEGGGYAALTDVRKDDQGIWRAMATRDGKPVAVALDFQGNVTGQ